MSIKVIDCFIGFGANLGDPIQQIIDARGVVSTALGADIVACSSFYVTSPVGYAQPDDFVNAVVKLKLSNTLDGMSVLRACQFAERLIGRVRDPKNQNAPRLIDCDVLLLGEQLSATDDLTLPHPRLAERRFVLEPLLEIEPTLTHKTLGSLAKILHDTEFGDQSCFRLSA